MAYLAILNVFSLIKMIEITINHSILYTFKRSIVVSGFASFQTISTIIVMINSVFENFVFQCLQI